MKFSHFVGLITVDKPTDDFYLEISYIFSYLGGGGGGRDHQIIYHNSKTALSSTSKHVDFFIYYTHFGRILAKSVNQGEGGVGAVVSEMRRPTYLAARLLFLVPILSSADIFRKLSAFIARHLRLTNVIL